MLTAKFVACKVAVLQMVLTYALRIGCFLSQQTSAIHEELSYSPAQFQKVDQPPLTSILAPQAGRGAVLRAASVLSSYAGIGFDERYVWD